MCHWNSSAQINTPAPHTYILKHTWDRAHSPLLSCLVSVGTHPPLFGLAQQRKKWQITMETPVCRSATAVMYVVTLLTLWWTLGCRGCAGSREMLDQPQYLPQTEGPEHLKENISAVAGKSQLIRSLSRKRKRSQQESLSTHVYCCSWKTLYFMGWMFHCWCLWNAEAAAHYWLHFRIKTRLTLEQKFSSIWHMLFWPFLHFNILFSTFSSQICCFIIGTFFFYSFPFFFITPRCLPVVFTLTWSDFCLLM